jgi:plastocyanin
MALRSITRTTVALAGATLFITACGGGSGGDLVAPADADVVVEALDNNRFDKSEYTAAAGDNLIAYLGRSAINHTLLVTDGDNKQIGDKLKVTSGKVDEGTFPLAAGSYTLFCDVPGHDSMKATLTVTP